MGEEENEFQQWKTANRAILKGMFSGSLSTELTREDVERYFEGLAKVYLEHCRRKRYPYAHSTIQTVIGNYFGLLDWDYGFEIPHGDLDSSYRFDIMAQEGDKTIVVEVKPEITTRELGQVMGYVHQVAKSYRKGRVFLGTDILNLGILGGGETTDIIMDYAKNYKLGVIFANKEQAWTVPAEFLLV